MHPDPQARRAAVKPLAAALVVSVVILAIHRDDYWRPFDDNEIDAIPSTHACGFAAASTVDLWPNSIVARDADIATGSVRRYLHWPNGFLLLFEGVLRLFGLSPDGKRLLFWGRRSATAPPAECVDWWVAPLDGGEPAQTGAYAAFRSRNLRGTIIPGVWMPAGNQVLFSATLGDSTSLWQMKLAPPDWKVAGVPERLTLGTDFNDQPSVAPGPGRLVFSSLTSHRDIWSLPINTSTGSRAGEIHKLTEGGASVNFGSISADGKRLVYASSRAANDDVWLKNLETGKETDLTPTPANEFHPRLAADASKVVYSMTKDGANFLYVVFNLGEITGNIWMAPLEAQK